MDKGEGYDIINSNNKAIIASLVDKVVVFNFFYY